jgi:hypothetical protein
MKGACLTTGESTEQTNSKAEASVVRYEREFHRLANDRKDKLLLIQTTIEEKLGKVVFCLT